MRYALIHGPSSECLIVIHLGDEKLPRPTMLDRCSLTNVESLPRNDEVPEPRKVWALVPDETSLRFDWIKHRRGSGEIYRHRVRQVPGYGDRIYHRSPLSAANSSRLELHRKNGT